MSLEGVNRQLSSVWTAWTRQWATDFQDAVTHWSLRTGLLGQSATLRFRQTPPPQAVLSVGDAPAYTALSRTRLSLAVPGVGAPAWHLHIVGTLEGGLFSEHLVPIHDKTIDIVIRNIHLAVSAVLDGDPVRPKLHPPAALTGGMEFDITGAITLQGTITLNTPPPGQPPVFQALITHQNFGGFIPAAGTVSMTLTLNATPTLTIRHLLPHDIHIPIKVPTSLTQFVGFLTAGGLPLDWPTAPQLTPVSAQATDPALASRLYRDTAADLEDGLEAHLPFLPDGAGGVRRRFSAILENVYPPIGLGTIIPNPDPTHPPTPTGTKSAGDCAIWTGHALAAEAFRYGDAVRHGDDTQKAEALRRAGDILAYIRLLFAVPHQATAVAGAAQTGLLCRCVLPASVAARNDDFDTAGKPDEYYHVDLPGDPDNPWLGKARGTDAPTRDSLTGIALGLTLAHQIITVPAVQQPAGEMLTDLLSYLLANEWNYPTPNGSGAPGPAWLDSRGKLKVRTQTSFFHDFLHQLAFLRAGASVNPAKFSGPYQTLAADLADAAWLVAWGDALDPVTGYFKFNLDHGCLLLLLFLEKDDPTLRACYREALAALRRATGHHRNALYQLVGVVAEPEYARQPSTGTVDETGRPLTVGAEIRVLLDEWIERRNMVQGANRLPAEAVPPTAITELELRYRNNRESFGDHTALSGDIVRNLSWAALPIRMRYAGSRPKPPHSGEPWAHSADSGQDFAWQRDPFGTHLDAGGRLPDTEQGDAQVEAPGVDGLLALWLAAYLGLLDKV